MEAYWYVLAIINYNRTIEKLYKRRFEAAFQENVLVKHLDHF